MSSGFDRLVKQLDRLCILFSHEKEIKKEANEIAERTFGYPNLTEEQWEDIFKFVVNKYLQ